LMAACTTQQNQNTNETPAAEGFTENVQQQFLDNLSTLCGFAYKGEELFRSPHGESWAGRDMTMYVSDCEQDKVFVPFHVNDDHSRTWMFTINEGKLQFRHRHLHEDGTPEDGSMYGGWATDDGTAFQQYFQADEYTASVIPGGGGNLWIVEIAPDFSWFSYRLDRDGEKRFELRFNLIDKVSL